MDIYRALLTRISANQKNAKSISDYSQSQYNLFRILEISAKEVIMCRFLTDFLNSEGAHGRGILLKLIRLIFDDFKTEMEKISEKYGLEPEQDALYYSYEENRHKKFYDCYSTYPGLNYVVKKTVCKCGSE